MTKTPSGKVVLRAEAMKLSDAFEETHGLFAMQPTTH